MRQVLGTTVFFGMLGVTIFGLFLTPTFYVVLRGLSQRFWGKKPHGEKAGHTAHGIAVESPK